MVIEGHSALRFAALQKELSGPASRPGGPLNGPLYVAYNAVWWVPVVLVAAGVMGYAAGFLGFAGITLARLIANLYRNNFLPPQQAIHFPFRA